jgi:hypothetical protein
VVSKFEQHHIFRLPHQPYSPDISPCDFWLFGLLKGIMKDCEFHSSEEIEDAITVAWNYLTFEDVQSILYVWTRRLASVIEYEADERQRDIESENLPIVGEAVIVCLREDGDNDLRVKV